MEICPSDEAVTLLSFGPRTARPAPTRSNKKSEKFTFKFRRRSKSAPRNQNTDKDISGKITYSANGETKLKNPDSPFKSDSVQLVGFSSYRGSSGDSDQCDPGVVTDSGHCVSLDSADTSYTGSDTLDKQCRAWSDSKTLSRTSKDIKMERERLRQERLANRSWLNGDNLRQLGEMSGSHQPPAAKLSLQSRLAEERTKFINDVSRDMFDRSDVTAELFNQFLKEREERLGLGGVGAPGRLGAFSGAGSHGSGSVSQLISSPGVSVSDSGHSDNSVHMTEPGHQSVSRTNNSDNKVSRTSGNERIIPITITRETVTRSGDQCDQVSGDSSSGQASVRIIPVMVETSDSSTDTCDNEAGDSSSTESNDSTPCQDESPKMPTFPSLLSDMKLGDSMLKPGRTSFHHPSFANHFGFARLRPADDKSIFSSGIRDSFPGFPNFGNFPSFTPILATDRPFPDRTHFRDKSKADSIHKQRLAKAKSSVEYSATDKPSETYR